MITAKVVGAQLVANGFLTAEVKASKAGRQVVRRNAQLLQTRIQAKASGRPGPNAPTGDYRRSWGIAWFEQHGGIVAQVGTNAPQGLRLEYGFVGTDVLGRHYDQPPFPHVGPACDEIEPRFVAEMEALVQTL